MPRDEDKKSDTTLIFYCFLMISSAILNSLTYKKMLNAFKSQDSDHPHNYEFFVNQVNVAMYYLVALIIVQTKAANNPKWYSKQTFYCRRYTFMGFLDAFSGFLSCVGGAYVGGAIQSLMNQTTIPITLLLSKTFLNSVYRRRQNIGSGIIVLGAICSVLPSLFSSSSSSSARSATTLSGVIVYFISIIPGGFSNVYKEYAFKESENPVDVYYMTTWVAFFQVVLGFMFLPAQLIPGLGDLSLDDMIPQLKDGCLCMFGINALEGDECGGAGAILVVYVAVNFFYNIFSLLVVKHGSANLSVVAAAVALPLTNMSFSSKFLMGKDCEKFDVFNLLSTAIVLAGFVFYSTNEKKKENVMFSPRTEHALEQKKPKGKTLGLAAAGGSVMYVRPRADSDPTTPFYTPMIDAAKREEMAKKKGVKLPFFKFMKGGKGGGKGGGKSLGVWVVKGEGEGVRRGGGYGSVEEFAPESL